MIFRSRFCAVLASRVWPLFSPHTAGGDVALRVNNDMMKLAFAMMGSGQNVWWNVAFQFLRVYHFIFRRISSGANAYKKCWRIALRPPNMARRRLRWD